MNFGINFGIQKSKAGRWGVSRNWGFLAPPQLKLAAGEPKTLTVIQVKSWPGQTPSDSYSISESAAMPPRAGPPLRRRQALDSELCRRSHWQALQRPQASRRVCVSALSLGHQPTQRRQPAEDNSRLCYSAWKPAAAALRVRSTARQEPATLSLSGQRPRAQPARDQ